MESTISFFPYFVCLSAEAVFGFRGTVEALQLVSDNAAL